MFVFSAMDFSPVALTHVTQRTHEIQFSSVSSPDLPSLLQSTKSLMTVLILKTHTFCLNPLFFSRPRTDRDRQSCLRRLWRAESRQVKMFCLRQESWRVCTVTEDAAKKNPRQVHKNPAKRKKKTLWDSHIKVFHPPTPPKKNSADCKNTCNWNFQASDLTLVDFHFHLKYLLSLFFVLWWLLEWSWQTDGQHMSWFSYLADASRPGFIKRRLFKWQEEFF